MCSLLSRQKKTSKLKLFTEEKDSINNLTRAKLEIERFEKDFVFLVLEGSESDKICDVDSSSAIISEDIKTKIIHSSCESINTDTDSGILLLSSEDRDSEDSDTSKVVKHISKKYSNGSDLDDEECYKKVKNHYAICLKRSQINQKKSFPNLSFIPLSIHMNSDCAGSVTINGVCYDCM